MNNIEIILKVSKKPTEYQDNMFQEVMQRIEEEVIRERHAHAKEDPTYEKTVEEKMKKCSEAWREYRYSDALKNAVELKKIDEGAFEDLPVVIEEVMDMMGQPSYVPVYISIKDSSEEFLISAAVNQGNN